MGRAEMNSAIASAITVLFLISLFVSIVTYCTYFDTPKVQIIIRNRKSIDSIIANAFSDPNEVYQNYIMVLLLYCLIHN